MKNFTPMLEIRKDYDKHFNVATNPEWFVRQRDGSLDLTYGVQEETSAYSNSKVIKTWRGFLHGYSWTVFRLRKLSDLCFSSFFEYSPRQMNIKP